MGIRSHLGALLLGILGFILTVPLHAQETGAPIIKYVTDVDEAEGLAASSALLPPAELLIEMGQQIEATDLDCSHFVQWLFEQAGLYYGYAPSRILYKGMPGFKRVSRPRRGDLIVWQGHVGIVVDPNEQTFLSALRSGVKTASYTSPYWKRRGRPRFFRHVALDDAPANRNRLTYYRNSGASASETE